MSNLKFAPMREPHEMLILRSGDTAIIQLYAPGAKPFSHGRLEETILCCYSILVRSVGQWSNMCPQRRLTEKVMLWPTTSDMLARCCERYWRKKRRHDDFPVFGHVDCLFSKRTLFWADEVLRAM